MGQNREAAAAYEELLERFPRDERAGLSAFELGRLRMDALDDPRGAIEPLTRALRAGGAFREDALARMARAHAAIGAREACARHRARYLDEYPEGAHAATVRELCP